MTSVRTERKAGANEEDLNVGSFHRIAPCFFVIGVSRGLKQELCLFGIG